MNATQINYRLRKDPKFLVNAILENNPLDVSQRLQDLGYWTDGTKQGMLDALFDLAKDHSKSDMFHALKVPILTEGMAPAFVEAIYGTATKNKYEVAKQGDPVAMAMLPVSSVEPTVDDVLGPLEDGSWTEWEDGMPGTADEGSNFDWGGLLGGVIDGVFGLFGNNGQQPGGQPAGYPPPTTQKDYTNVILISVMAIVLVAFAIAILNMTKK